MKTVSWILLTIVTVLIILGSLGSISIAYFGSPSSDIITNSTSLEDLGVSPEASTALRGRRGTAAAFGLSLGVLLLFVVLGPYRKGAAWAWWAVLTAVIVLCGAMLLRIAALGTVQGAATAGLILLIVIPALLLNLAGRSAPPQLQKREPQEPPSSPESSGS